MALLRESERDGLRFRFEGSDTRFLGDLYEEISEGVRDRYALLQTPKFIEEFILEQTLVPAIQEFGLEVVRAIDPTCGSGHFLLGAFRKLFEYRLTVEPSIERREHARRALAQVYGIDLNPYAVAIARFRLTLAYFECADVTSLRYAPRIETNLAVADSLLHGGLQRRLSEPTDAKIAWGDTAFEFDDRPAAEGIFKQQYHVVVGNPPYIACRDAALRELYRERYESATGKFTLAAPFVERFFQLGVDGGYVGMINANSFAQNVSGKTLVVKVLPRLDVSLIVDMSKAVVPGNDTSSLLLFGRNRRPLAPSLRVVLGKKGEDRPEGEYWQSAKTLAIAAGTREDEYASAADVSREQMSKHPWSFGGSQAVEVRSLLESIWSLRLDHMSESIGFMAITGADEVFARSGDAWRRLKGEAKWLRRTVTGRDIRDWQIRDSLRLPFPYANGDLASPSEFPAIAQALWPYRRWLLNRPDFGGKKYIDVGRPWWSFHQVPLGRLDGRTSIAFAEQSTHNHFISDNGTFVFDRTAPVIRPLPTLKDVTLSALTAYLGSAIAASWFRSVCRPKGGDRTAGGRVAGFMWEDRIVLKGTIIAGCPIPPLPDLERMGRELQAAAHKMELHTPRVWLPEFVGNLELLNSRASKERSSWQGAFRRLVFLQEELDWRLYQTLGWADTEDLSDISEAEILPEWRPFEMLITKEGDLEGWQSRNNRNAPSSYSEVSLSPKLAATYESRLKLISEVALLRFIEQPQYKRRWEVDSFDDSYSVALHNMFQRLAERIFEGAPQVRTCREVAILLRDSAEAQAFASALGGEEADLEALFVKVFSDHCVPMCTALTLRVSAQRKRVSWETAWELQRVEDVGLKVTIPVPEPYVEDDFEKKNYWRLRGSLNVPAETWISYPSCERDQDNSPLVGWAGWNYLERAQVLAALFQERKEQDGWEAERLTPILVGLLELVPWVKQWHNEPDPSFDDQRMGDVYEAFVSEKARELRLTLDDLRNWRPQPKTKKPKADSTSGDPTTPKRARRKKAAADDTAE